jgi:putative proteasome-type protease
MTYCLGIKVKGGLVLAADSRTNAGVDDVRTYSKMQVFEFPGGRFFVLLSAGNLATTHSVRQYLQRDLDNPRAEYSLAHADHMFDAAEYLGQLNVRAQKAVANDNPENIGALEANFILGGQIRGEEPSLYLVYALGNCISTSTDYPFLQIGESKYGKPILDRIIRPELPLEDAARCALVSLDSTMRSNISVAPPLDLLIYERDAFSATRRLRLDYDTPYYRELKSAWGRELESSFSRLPRFDWEPAAAPAPSALQQAAQHRNEPAARGPAPADSQSQQQQSQALK